jgi:hypothetical protein
VVVVRAAFLDHRRRRRPAPGAPPRCVGAPPHAVVARRCERRCHDDAENAENAEDAENAKN